MERKKKVGFNMYVSQNRYVSTTNNINRQRQPEYE